MNILLGELTCGPWRCERVLYVQGGKVSLAWWVRPQLLAARPSGGGVIFWGKNYN